MKHNDIVIFSTADWDNPFWTNKQHVALELNKRGHRVFYIDSVGLRRPSTASADLKRIVTRVKKACGGPQKIEDNLWVWSPLIMPLHYFRVVTTVNRMILNATLHFWLHRLNFRTDILWTYNPMTTRLINISKFTYIVYHCVDEIKAQPGMPGNMIEKAEEELLKKADIVFTTSSQLLKSRKVLNPRSYYFPNVADHDHFSRALLHDTIVPDDLRVIQPPRIGFIGAISSYKIDFNLIAYVARAHPDWSVVLIGKVGEGDPWTNIENIKNLPNVFILGPRPYTQLPAYLKGIDVAILPNQLNAYTQAMFPMKFFEYLAAGKPIVSVNLPALREYSDMAYLAKSYEDFVLGIEKALDDSVEKRIKRSMIASQYTYKNRTEQMMLIIEKELALESTSKALESE